MSPTPVIRTFAPHEWRTYRDLRLRSLADTPDAFGRTLAEEQTRPDSEWSARLESGVVSAGDLPLLAEVNGEAAGLTWGRIQAAEPETACLYQMWVAPECRGLGAGRMLLDAVIEWAKEANARRLVLSVTVGDTPATRLYARAGFIPVGEREPLRPDTSLRAQPMLLNLKPGAD